MTLGTLVDMIRSLEAQELEVSLMENQLIDAKLNDDFTGILESDLKQAKQILLIMRSDEIL